MSPVLADRPQLRRDRPTNLGRAAAFARRSDSSGGRKLTLQQKLDSVWEGLRAEGAAECPVCAGRMVGADRACCRDCGSRLA